MRVRVLPPERRPLVTTLRSAPVPRRPLALAAAALLAAGAAACGSSTTTSGPSSSATPASPSTTVAASGGSAAGDANQFSTGPVPAVAGATDMKAAPTIHAGTGPAPVKLVGSDLVVGTGTAAAGSNTVEIQYVGALYSNGKVFDSSWSRGQPASFPLSGVIPGFAQGIVGMKVGGRRELVIPPALGYGDQANGSIPANSTLTFVIDLLGVS